MLHVGETDAARLRLRYEAVLIMSSINLALLDIFSILFILPNLKQHRRLAMTSPITKSEIPPELGKYLKDIRNSRGYSLRKVEQLTEGKISNGYLSQLENGEIARPSAVMLHRLAGAYGVDYGHLMERAGFITESEAPANRAATSVLGELTQEEEEQLLNFLGYLRSQKVKK